MEFGWSEEQWSLRDEVIRFARSELAYDLINKDFHNTFSKEAWEKCAHFGIQGLPIPERYGGHGADLLTVILAMEALGYGCSDNGLIFSLNAQMWSCEIPIVRSGTEEQKERYLPGLCDGSLIGVQAMTEPDSGSDAFALATTAKRTTDGWVLNGTKTFITNGPVADVFVVFAKTDPRKGFAGISVFLVDRGTPGLTTGRPFDKMGLRTSPMSELGLANCEVPDSAVLGRVGAGMPLFSSSMEWERGCILAGAIGTMERQLERGVAYARERRQFGQPIGKFQAISHTIVDMKVRLETARLLLYRFGWLKTQRRSASLESAMVKLYLSECFVQSSLDVLQIHGASGYMTEYELERDVRDSVASRIYSGTSDIQRNLIAGLMGL